MTPAPANRATPVRTRSPRRKGRSGQCRNVRPKWRPADRNTARCPPHPAASPLWPARAPRHPVPRVSRHFPATPRCTHPSLARVRRRAARRARPRSSVRTAIRLRIPDLTHAPHSGEIDVRFGAEMFVRPLDLTRPSFGQGRLDHEGLSPIAGSTIPARFTRTLAAFLGLPRRAAASRPPSLRRCGSCRPRRLLVPGSRESGPS